MKAIGIITDSHSSIDQKKAEELGIMVLPMPFSIGGKCYYEGVTLSRKNFFRNWIPERILRHHSRRRKR